jgi:hypothetical protein
MHRARITSPRGTAILPVYQTLRATPTKEQASQITFEFGRIDLLFWFFKPRRAQFPALNVH